MDGGRTMTEKLCVALIGGIPLSVTTTVNRLVEGACDIFGRQVIRPFAVLIVAPVGGAVRLQVKVCAGTPLAFAVLVTTNVCPAVIVMFEIGPKIGAGS